MREGKIALVTGAAKGIGRAIALALAVAFGTHQANEAARWRYEAQGMGQTEIVTPQNQNTAVQP